MYLPSAAEAELVHAFIYGLNTDIKRELITTRHKTVNDAMTDALAIGERLTGLHSSNPSTFFNKKNKSYNNDVVPMELGGMRSKGKKKWNYSNNRNNNNSNNRSNNKGNRGGNNRNNGNNNNNSRNNKPPSPCKHCGGDHWNW